jgi:hypothetical protein
MHLPGADHRAGQRQRPRHHRPARPRSARTVAEHAGALPPQEHQGGPGGRRLRRLGRRVSRTRRDQARNPRPAHLPRRHRRAHARQRADVPRGLRDRPLSVCRVAVEYEPPRLPPTAKDPRASEPAGTALPGRGDLTLPDDAPPRRRGTVPSRRLVAAPVHPRTTSVQPGPLNRSAATSALAAERL